MHQVIYLIIHDWAMEKHGYTQKISRQKWRPRKTSTFMHWNLLGRASFRCPNFPRSGYPGVPNLPSDEAQPGRSAISLTGACNHRQFSLCQNRMNDIYSRPLTLLECWHQRTNDLLCRSSLSLPDQASLHHRPSPGSNLTSLIQHCQSQWTGSSNVRKINPSQKVKERHCFDYPLKCTFPSLGSKSPYPLYRG